MMCGLLITLLITSVANAAELKWDPPTQRMNGTPITSDEIAGYNIYVDGELSGSVSGNLTSTSIHLDTSTNDKHCVSLQTVDTNGLKSQLSDEKCFNLVSPPNAPTNVQISIVNGNVSIVITSGATNELQNQLSN